MEKRGGIFLGRFPLSDFLFLFVKRRPILGLDGFADIHEFGFAPRKLGDAAGHDVDERTLAVDLDAYGHRSVRGRRSGTNTLGRIGGHEAGGILKRGGVPRRDLAGEGERARKVPHPQDGVSGAHKPFERRVVGFVPAH